VATTYVYDFSHGDKDQAALLGGKGANLAEMTKLGLPVPPGFTITTEACRAWLATGEEPEGLGEQVSRHLEALESAMDRRLGDAEDPLLVSVRSGAAISMPGMMETVLNVGMNDRSVHGLASRSQNERFAWDSYRRLVQMFGATVLDIDAGLFAQALDDLKDERGAADDVDLSAADLEELTGTFQRIVKDATGADFPQEPRQQLDLAIRAVFGSWNTERAKIYRRQERIPDDMGTAVNVVAMVFGNLGPDSGTGVCFTRDPASGEQGIYGDYLQNAQGEDVVAGIRNTVPLADLEQLDPAAYRELLAAMETLERHYRDLCDIEFTIEAGKLWMLQTRVGKRTPAAAFRIAVQLVDEGAIDLDEALQRVTGAQLALLMFPQFDPKAKRDLIATGMAASPGAAVGKAAFDSATAIAWANDGEDVILVRRETNPDDLGGMVAARGVLTSRGGKTSHAAVVARGMGRTCVVGVEALRVDPRQRTVTTPDGRSFAEGDVISIDGGTGEVFLGEVPVSASAVTTALTVDAQDDQAESQGDLVESVRRLMRHADSRAGLGVRANADNGEDAARARGFGAQGIGLCRTEHMFLGERRKLVEQVILARGADERRTHLRKLLPLQRKDFGAILTAMDGLPVTIRLLDPPLHEFLPDLTALSVEVAVNEATGEVDKTKVALLQQVQRLHEQNPMLGMRGVRLGIVVPELYELQVRAVAEAYADLREKGQDPRPEVMIPLVAAVQELELLRERTEAAIADVAESRGIDIALPVGTMIELPRAAMTAHQIAPAADFFSFGTNDLTQTAWGFSRDDVEAAFFAQYVEAGIFAVSPFESLDTDGVGRLVSIAAWEGKESNPDLKIGVCGEHGGDPDSIHFFASILIDYVSCSPFRVPVARLESGRAALMVTPRTPGE
jgi:pyruvate,orthophosphate dikinase